MNSYPFNCVSLLTTLTDLCSTSSTSKTIAIRLQRLWDNPGSSQLTEREIFESSVRGLDKAVNRMTLHADAAKRSVEHLSMSVRNVIRIATQELALEKEDRNKLLSRLWTVLGGNRERLDELRNNIGLLESLLVFEEPTLLSLSKSKFILSGMRKSITSIKTRMELDPNHGDAMIQYGEIEYLVARQVTGGLQGSASQVA